jgi:pilus assembly protein Flp/PilA
MKLMLISIAMKLRDLKRGEDGQDLVEYALVIALVALAAISGIGVFATSISTEFTTLAGSV